MRYRVGLWSRQNEGDAKYRFAVDARLKNGSYPVLATVPVTSKSDAWRELVTEVVAPPDATSILLRLYVDKQANGARCWIDNVFIGR
ncbi:MAG: hypothetical protein M3463_08395 [Verrucomicrobiota bacterium]|nr:hypothetical protein [Verrucomicrobiota bacterium]